MGFPSGDGFLLPKNERPMGDIVFLRHIKRQRLAERAFRLWRRFFPAQGLWNENTSWKDLPNTVLLAFASESDDAQTALHDFIMVCQNLGHGQALPSQDWHTLCRLLDGYFYLIDQARFEIMARLGWVERSAAAQRPLIDIACDSSIYGTGALVETPALRPDHPEYGQDRAGTGMERAVLVRKAIPEAIRRFRAALAPETVC